MLEVIQSRVEKRYGAIVAIDHKVPVFDQFGREAKGRLAGSTLGFLAAFGAGNNQRSSSLIDQDAVGLVNNSEVEAAEQQPIESWIFLIKPLDLKARSIGVPAEDDPVFQVVKRHFLVGAISDVTTVSRTALRRIETMNDGPHGQSQSAVDRPHPLRVAIRQIVVN